MFLIFKRPGDKERPMDLANNRNMALNKNFSAKTAINISVSQGRTYLIFFDRIIDA